MTISGYLRLLRVRWLTVVLCALLGTGTAAALAVVQTPRFEAGCQLFVGANTPAAGGTADLGQLSQGGAFVQQRVRSYTDLVTSPGVLEPVVRSLGLPGTAADLATHVHASSPLDTVLIDITVDATTPQRAADVANGIAARFPAEVTRLEAVPGRPDSPVTLTVTRSATVPSSPAAPRVPLYVALGVLVGLGVGLGLAVLRDSLDRTIGTRSQLAELTGLPVLGAVADDPRFAAQPLVAADDMTARAEAYRQLRTNIRFLSVDRDLRSLVVTGSLPGEGKSTTAANLAVALARSGERVALIDADLRRPSIADLFALPGGVGLTTVLIGDVAVTDALQPWHPDLPLEVLAAGPPPPNPSELLSSTRMADLVRELTCSGRTVIIDSPPLLPVTDAAVLARVTDGALLVVRAASTRTDQVGAAVDALAAAGAPLLGMVLTRTPRQASPYHGGYGGYGAYAPQPSADSTSAASAVANSGNVGTLARPPAARHAHRGGGSRRATLTPDALPVPAPAAGPLPRPAPTPALSPIPRASSERPNDVMEPDPGESSVTAPV